MANNDDDYDDDEDLDDDLDAEDDDDGEFESDDEQVESTVSHEGEVPPALQELMQLTRESMIASVMTNQLAMMGASSVEVIHCIAAIFASICYQMQFIVTEKEKREGRIVNVDERIEAFAGEVKENLINIEADGVDKLTQATPEKMKEERERREARDAANAEANKGNANFKRGSH